MPCSKLSTQSQTYPWFSDVDKQHCQNPGAGRWFCWRSCLGLLEWVSASKDTMVGLRGHSHACFPPASVTHHVEDMMGWVPEDQPKYETPILGDLELFMGKSVPFDFPKSVEKHLTTGHGRGSCHQFLGGHFSRSLQESREGEVVLGWILPTQVSLPNLGRSMGHMDLCARTPSAPTTTLWQASKDEVREQTWSRAGGDPLAQKSSGRGLVWSDVWKGCRQPVLVTAAHSQGKGRASAERAVQTSKPWPEPTRVTWALEQRLKNLLYRL